MHSFPPFLTSSLLHPICHGFFTRIGGVSTSYFESLNTGNNKGDSIQNTIENRSRICNILGQNPNSLVLGAQKHTTDVMYVDKPFDNELPIIDGLVTDIRRLVLAIQTADCVPVLLADPKKGIIAAVHAGWRGATEGILDNAVKLMKEVSTNHASDLIAAIGPCIWQRSYEVGPEFQTILKDSPQFLINHPIQREHFLFDLPGYVKNALNNLGIEQISHSPYDTFTEESMFFSYRRSTIRKEPQFGVQLSCISL